MRAVRARPVQRSNSNGTAEGAIPMDSIQTLRRRCRNRARMARLSAAEPALSSESSIQKAANATESNRKKVFRSALPLSAPRSYKQSATPPHIWCVTDDTQDVRVVA